MTRRSTRWSCTVLAAGICVTGAVSLSFGRDEDREKWQPPKQIMDAVGVREGMRIGEAGAGEGYLTFPLAKRVGDRGIVYANDISAGDLEVIRDRAQREGVENIVTVLGEIEDPLFPERDLDMVIMVYVLHHLDRPVEFLRNLEHYLKPGAPVVIVEKNTDVERTRKYHFMTGGQVQETIEAAGFALERTETSLPRDTIYVIRVRRKPVATGSR